MVNSMKELLEYLNRIGELNYLTTILRWEMDTIAPSKSFDYLINISTKIDLESFKLYTSEELINLINKIDINALNDFDRIYINDLKEDYERFKRVPEDFYEEFSKLKNNSLNSWVQAKKENNYSIYKPYLIKIIEMTKQFYRYMYPNSENLYDEMLGTYEKGINTKLVDKLFSELKEGIKPIIDNLKPKNISKNINTYSDSELINISRYLLDYIGFDNSRGALGIFSHGYTIKMNDNDVRIAFSNESDIFDHMSTIIHEGGHGIFEQNISDELRKFGSYDIDKVALHESQSRFYENILGRNINFWIPIYDDIKELLHIDLNINDFMDRFNNAKVSLIRTKADELTYCMHIIIRYEIEKEIFNGNIDLENLDKIWNQKYKEYLGIDVPSDREGILQDMHWSDGSFGYFPTYLLGSIFDGMLLENINNKLGDVDELLKTGRIREITKYLNDNIHLFGGSYNINEVANRLCNSDLDVKPIINYFKSKYSK